MLALSNRAMPLHDTGKTANARFGLPSSITEVRHCRGWYKSILVRWRNEDAGKSISRKVIISKRNILRLVGSFSISRKKYCYNKNWHFIKHTFRNFRMQWCAGCHGWSQIQSLQRLLQSQISVRADKRWLGRHHPVLGYQTSSFPSVHIGCTYVRGRFRH